MAEARNLRNTTMAQTPLLSEANTPLHELVGRGTRLDSLIVIKQGENNN